MINGKKHFQMMDKSTPIDNDSNFNEQFSERRNLFDVMKSINIQNKEYQEQQRHYQMHLDERNDRSPKHDRFLKSKTIRKQKEVNPFQKTQCSGCSSSLSSLEDTERKRLKELEAEMKKNKVKISNKFSKSYSLEL